MRKIIRREISPEHCQLPESINPILKRVYACRGITSAEQLESKFEHLHPFHNLRGIDDAVTLLHEALQQHMRILIVADFDADGATSCATVVRALRQFGAKHVDYIVPNRFSYGYGLTPEIVEVAKKYNPDLLITVDNGISSIEGVAAARQAGIKVLITDHHLPGAELPNAHAIVNPNQGGDDFPSKNLAGVGVVFYVMLALRATLRKIDWFSQAGIREPNLGQLLDLVALGTVADVVPMDQTNRILVAQGLKRIRHGRCCAGITALLSVARRDASGVVATDLGFAIGPRLNAAGRLDDMSLGIECLLTDDAAHAARLATELDRLNCERREIEAKMKHEAVTHLTALEHSTGGSLPTGVCLFNETWHQGVIGIIASRIKEQLHRPVIAFARVNNDELKGSARSVASVHIRDVLSAVATASPGLLKKFGGHAMAAGLSIVPDKFDTFCHLFNKEIERHLGADDLQGVVYSDGELGDHELNLEVAEQLREGGPWGQGFPEPTFDGVFHVLNHRTVGEKHLKMLLKSATAAKPIDAIAFNTLATEWPDKLQRVQIAYRLDVNEYRGQRTPQLMVEYIQPV